MQPKEDKKIHERVQTRNRTIMVKKIPENGNYLTGEIRGKTVNQTRQNI